MSTRSGDLRQTAVMDRTSVMEWVARYEASWRTGDVDALPTLFAPDVVYLTGPYADARVGLASVESFWLDDEGLAFTVDASPVAIDGDTAVVRLEVTYHGPPAQQFRDLWILRFDPDGRVDAFEEWPFSPS